MVSAKWFPSKEKVNVDLYSASS